MRYTSDLERVIGQKEWTRIVKENDRKFAEKDAKIAAFEAFVAAFDAYLNDAESGNSTTLWQWNRLLSARDGLAAELTRDKLKRGVIR